MDSVFEQVQQIIQEKFGQDVAIDFHDEKGDGKHFFLSIVSEDFTGTSRIERSRIVHELLDDLLTTGGIHALRLNLKAPAEL